LEIRTSLLSLLLESPFFLGDWSLLFILEIAEKVFATISWALEVPFEFIEENLLFSTVFASIKTGLNLASPF
jgi:hypothetical protein